jgi:enamidase
MLETALTAGVDTIEHVPLPFCLETEAIQTIGTDHLHLADHPRLAAQLDRMVEQGVILVPTLDVNRQIINKLYWLTPTEREASLAFVLEIVGYFHRQGGLIALGNDYGHPGIQSGMPLAEMELLLAAGLTPAEVIEACTRHAAQAAGQADQLGSLEPGKLADLLVVAGDPLTDIQRLNQVTLVVKGGEIVYASGQEL